MSNDPSPARGEVWTVDLDPTRGREQAGRRPALIISADEFNGSPRGLVVVVPISGTDRAFPTHVRIVPPEGGVVKPSVVMVEQIRTIAKARLERRMGSVNLATIEEIALRLRMLLKI